VNAIFGLLLSSDQRSCSVKLGVVAVWIPIVQNLDSFIQHSSLQLFLQALDHYLFLRTIIIRAGLTLILPFPSIRIILYFICQFYINFADKLVLAEMFRSNADFCIYLLLLTQLLQGTHVFLLVYLIDNFFVFLVLPVKQFEHGLDVGVACQFLVCF